MATTKKRPPKRQGPDRRLLWVVGGIVVVAVLVGVAASSGGPDSSPSGDTARAGPLRTEPPWPPQYTGLGDRVEAAGVPPVGDESYHVHALLSVFVGGNPVTVPANIGIDQEARFMSPLHTHTPDGVIHFEADEPAPFTLGQVFAVWGVDFSPTRLGAYTAQADQRVHVFVNGERVEDPLRYRIADQDNVVVAFGRDGSFPTEPPADALNFG